MRTMDFEAIFLVNFVQFWINFHSFKPRLSFDTDLIHIIKKILFDRQKKSFLEF